MELTIAKIQFFLGIYIALYKKDYKIAIHKACEATFEAKNDVTGDWSMTSPPTCQEVIDVTSTRPLSKDLT